jgi:protein involved in polysaccharide export with SLBB domain
MERKRFSLVERKGDQLSMAAPISLSAWQLERAGGGALRKTWRGVVGSFAVSLALFVSGVLLAQSDANYRLAANDLLDFRVFQEPELDSVIRVSGDGNAIFPLVGSIPLAGKTVGEATELLRQRYMAGYLVNPQITLTVRTYARKVFTILGQVAKPGSYAIEGGGSISLLDAIGMAGGYTRIANPGKVTVKRREGGRETVIRVDARKMAKSSAESSFQVQPGDVVTVAESIF